MHREEVIVQEESIAHLDGADGQGGTPGDGGAVDCGGVESVVEGGEPLAKRARARRLPRDGGGQPVRWGPAQAAGHATDADDAATPTGKSGPLPKAGVGPARAAGGVRYPAVRDGSGRKGQYGNDELGGRLRLWRERVALSQTELAIRVGVSSPNISHYERSARAPSKEVCKRLRMVMCLTDAEYIQLLEWS